MELILITNDPKLARYAERSDIDTIMIDLEILGKKERQRNMNTVISNHSLNDISNIRKVLKYSKLLVRINPINPNSKIEINEVIKRGTDAIMLPMFKNRKEVEIFLDLVNQRVETYLLLETPQALVRIEDILELEGIDAIHIGLNDLHLLMGLDFMFELLSSGVIEYLASIINKKGIKYGFGGIAKIGEGLLSSELILSEHVRLNSNMVILSRSFKGFKEKYNEIVKLIDLPEEIKKIREYIEILKKLPKKTLIQNKVKLRNRVKEIIKSKIK